ncbi:hypothetical protein MHU86_4686 [Fragilaria crotonensis]|nr:hypothetical protein MHU86_4686 [Fragilaria crotonensis]
MFRRKSRGIDPMEIHLETFGILHPRPGEMVERPPDGKRSFMSLLQDSRINDRYSVARGSSEVVDLTSEIQLQSRAKRKTDAQIAAQDETKRSKHGPISEKLVQETYWDSPEAKKLFLGNANDSRGVVDILEQRIERLQQVNRTVDGWKDVVEKHDKDNLCSSYDIFMIRQRCSILCLAYTYALEEMNSARWIEDCCAAAIVDCSKMGMEAAATNERTVAGWNILLRANREHFPMPNPKILKKRPLPDLLEYFRDEITSPWLGYCIENLADLTVEMARNHLVTSLIPSAAAARTINIDVVDNNEIIGEVLQEEEGGSSMQQKTIKGCLLRVYLESPISLSTTWRWLRRLGFTYDTRKKSFFVDGHERANVVFRRNEFCTHYLTKLESRAHRWIQVTAETVEEWRREKKMSDDDSRGYKYTSDDNKDMVEFHVDDLDLLHKHAETMGFGAFGGNLSVRKAQDEKPLMIFGQDESVYSQFLLGNRQWVGPEGQRPLLPKTDGLSLMISALQSRETGFGVEISRVQLEEINEARRGKTYVDVDAAMAIHSQAAKKDLKQSPFVVYFELGANNEGYWTYNHMSIQFEDCVDCLRVLYPHFDFAFLFDHSQGHAKKLANGLDAYTMNRGFGGVQPRMRESKIKAEDGYLGMHERTVNAGDTQSFVFESGDAGPFWMTENEREINRHDRILPPLPGNPRKRNKTISELKAELGPLNILNDRRQYRLLELQELARTNNIDVKTNTTREKKGWQGQAKGLLQVLWERGWIDEGNLEKYTMDPATDADGEVLEGAEEWSLRVLMASCLDFAEEVTALQHVGNELGVSVIISPKFHAELAGEGIEYSWGVTKGIYRRKPLNSKRSKEAFKALVMECTSRNVLRTETVRKLSRRARAYICAYYLLYESKKNNNHDDAPILTLPLIERIVMAFKTHRAALDFDAGFVNGFVHSLLGEEGVFQMNT